MHNQAFLEMRQALNETGVSYLLTDAEVGHTLLDAAETTGNPEDRARRIREANKAYKTILHLLTKVTPNPEQQLKLEGRLASLRQRLLAVGVELDEQGAG